MFPVAMVERRVALRELAVADAPALAECLTHPLVAATVVDEVPSDLDAYRDLIISNQRAAQAVGRTTYRLAVVVTGRVVGNATLTVTSVAHARGEIGYFLHPDLWGRGLATEVAGMLLSLGFGELSLHRIEATTAPDNEPSRRVLEKVGMRFEGRIRDHYQVRGVWRDSLSYAILATDPR